MWRRRWLFDFRVEFQNDFNFQVLIIVLQETNSN